MVGESGLIKIAIAGLGHIGSVHIEALKKFKEIQICAVCDLDPSLKKIIPDSIPFYTDYDQLLEKSNADTIIIATPNKSHFNLAMKAYEAGKNVILEKPAAETLSQVRKLDEGFQKSNSTHIYYAFHAAFGVDVDWFCNWYDQNHEEMGPITGFGCHFYDPYFNDHTLLPEAYGLGDSWTDSGVNALSVLSRFLDLNSFDMISKTITNEQKDNIAVQALVGYRFYCNDVAGLGFINTNWKTGKNYKATWLTFARSNQIIKLNHSEQSVTRFIKNGKGHPLFKYDGEHSRLVNHYIGVFRDYLSALNRNTFNGPESLLIHKILYT